jgi:hypothetical protein
LRQGDAIAPVLLNVVLEISVETYKIETRGTTFDKWNQIMVYAGDVDANRAYYILLSPLTSQSVLIAEK